MRDVEQRKAAKEFAAYWQNKGYEKGESQKFWLSLLRDVYGVEHPEQMINFEDQVHLDHTSFIDAMIPETHVMIEQKALGKNLKAAIKQSDGSLLTPFQQAKRYSAELPYSQRPRWIVTCNFSTFHIYDMEQPGGEPEEIQLADLEKEYYRLNFLVDAGNEHLKKEMEVSIQAGELVGVLYDALLEQYADKTSEASLKSLNMLCVRLVFCLYAEDAGIFGKKGMFHDYMRQFPTKEWHKHLIELFRVLDTKEEERYKIDKYMEDDLAAFPYVNGGLFADEEIEVPRFTDEIVDLILNRSSEDFDWSQISPTIFGAVFESTLNPETRRSGGMHYTSIENIHKVIDPLFLDELREELEVIKELKTIKAKKEKLEKFQQKLASLTFLDPACGSGNFLTETYISLRRLENEAIELLQGDGQIQFGFGDVIRVGINQFYGIEINDFAVKVAMTSLWIAESQMMKETEDIIHMSLNFLPLKSYTNITEGNALHIDWNEVISKYELNYIMGNPPFIGARWMNNEQKQDVIDVFGAKWKNVGNLDYVSCWYKKSQEYMKNTNIRAALVSTNSIVQGESVANLWKPLFENGIHIEFAHRTFRWDSEANLKAQVHCVIIGFSLDNVHKQKVIYNDNRPILVKNINGYLLDADNVFIEKRMKPISKVPEISLGGQAIDDGNFIFTIEEKEEFLKAEPQAEAFVRPYMMGKDFINRKPRFCLWLINAEPKLLKTCPMTLERVKKVKEFRLLSSRANTLKAAETPTLFGQPFECKTSYIAIPKVSSENRRYIPMDFLPAEIIPGDKLFTMQNASEYEFGVMMSNVHMAWMRAVCGRLKSDYSYSNTIVYNNFPWPNPTDEQKEKIKATAKAILDMRKLYPNSSLADLYDDLTMPPELRKAHQANDKAVMQAYGFWGKLNSETECVAELMKMYQELTDKA